MSETIKLLKLLVINQNEQDKKLKDIYNLLNEELIQQTKYEAHPGSLWHLHKEQNTLLYQKVSRNIDKLAYGLINEYSPIEITIPERNNKNLKLQYSQIEIMNFVWNGKAEFKLNFISDLYILQKNFDLAIVIKAVEGDDTPLMVDLNDPTISFAAYNN